MDHRMFQRIICSLKNQIKKMSFKTGVIVLLTCIPFYILSFAQMMLPISTTGKGILWVLFFGMAKTAQYGGITILGAEGIRRIKTYRRRRKY